MSEPLQKRLRCANFTAEEKITLLNIVKKYSHIVECKKTDAVTWRDKDAAWGKVAAEFNANCPSGNKRSSDNLKKFFENQKKNARKKAAEKRLALYCTGGGPNTSDFSDPTLDLTLSIINEKSTHGLDNKFDGDQINANIDQQEWEATYNVENEEEIILEVEDAVDMEEANINDENNWKHYKPNSLKKPLTEKLKNVVQSGTSETPKTPLKRRLSTEHTNMWSTRRRPANTANESVARKFEELTNIKIEIANYQLSILKMEKENKLTKFSRDNEEYTLKKLQCQEIHELQKSSLQLDIAIKNKQIEKLNNL